MSNKGTFDTERLLADNIGESTVSGGITFDDDVTFTGNVTSNNISFMQVVASADSFTTTPNVENDVTGMSLTLTPGKWLMQYNVAACLAFVASSAVVRCRITTSSNVILAGSTHLVTSQFSNTELEITGAAFVDISTNTTYKLRFTTVGTGSSGIRGTDLTGSLTVAPPDFDSTFWAVRIV